MALREYRCSDCGAVDYHFDGEFPLDPGSCKKRPAPHLWERMPPRVTTVLATNMFMLDEPQLDSIASIYELDRQLNIEERAAKETEMFQEIRRNL